TPPYPLSLHAALPISPAHSSGAAIMPSAPLGAGPIQAARNAAAATNAHIAGETGQDVPPPKGARPASLTPAPTPAQAPANQGARSEEHTSELQSPCNL